MSSRHVAFICTLTVVFLVGLLTTGLIGQDAEDDAALGQTPWGDPNLQGIWGAGYIYTPLERPDEFEGREFLTDDEATSLTDRQTSTFGIGAGAGGGNTTGRPEKGTLADVQGAYNDVYTGRGTEAIATGRTSLIIDPPDGKIPYLPGVKEQWQKDHPRATDDMTDGPEMRGSDRCMGVHLPVAYGQAVTAGGHKRIVQAPEHVAIYYEHGHHGGAYRDIPMDGRSHPPAHVRQWLGHATGRWEGQTLVVETTNFTGKTRYQGATENMVLTERFTPSGSDTLMYQATIEDASAFSAPWTIEVPLNRLDNRDNKIYEAACHEGNYAMISILAGGRLSDQ
tara:strand:- start:2677 stop:3690 length:1014 start_codon:yes stop_codon:yes gene_type:complete